MTRETAKRIGEESILDVLGGRPTRPAPLKTCQNGHRYREGTKACGGCPECRRARNTLEARRYRRAKERVTA